MNKEKFWKERNNLVGRIIEIKADSISKVKMEKIGV